MLVLTRKLGESIVIGDEVSVRVLGIRGGQVSLGFTAPESVRIFREEVVKTIEVQNQGAALPASDALSGAEETWKEYGHGKSR